MMEFAFPALSAFKAIGCMTQTKTNENIIDATATPFRTPSLLTDSVAKTCTELTARDTAPNRPSPHRTARSRAPPSLRSSPNVSSRSCRRSSAAST